MQQFRFRDRGIAEKVIEKIGKYGIEATFMHVCGTHQDTLLRYGLDTLLEKVNIKIKAGPVGPCMVSIEEACQIEYR